MNRRIWMVLVLIAGAGLVFFGRSALGKEKRRVGHVVPAAQRVPLAKISHKQWDALLRAFVDENGNVNYRGWAGNAEAQKGLDEYLGQLSRADLNQPASVKEKLAFWINAYNAVTVKGILMEYPTKSIRNHTSRFGGYNIWDDLLLQVGGMEISLNDMEHKILRKLGDPRIHFAIVCASRSCPRLLNRAYVPQSIDQQLNANAAHFFSQPSNLQVSNDGRTVHLSSILKWFGEDFGRNESEIWNRIKPFLPQNVAARIQGQPRFRYQSYDWSLNGV